MTEQHYIIRCGRLYIGVGPAVRVTTAESAQKFTLEEAKRKMAALLSGNRSRYPLPWEMESFHPEDRAQ